MNEHILFSYKIISVSPNVIFCPAVSCTLSSTTTSSSSNTIDEFLSSRDMNRLSCTLLNSAPCSPKRKTPPFETSNGSRGHAKYASHLSIPFLASQQPSLSKVYETVHTTFEGVFSVSVFFKASNGDVVDFLVVFEEEEEEELEAFRTNPRRSVAGTGMCGFLVVVDKRGRGNDGNEEGIKMLTRLVKDKRYAFRLNSTKNNEAKKKTGLKTLFYFIKVI